MIRSIAAAAAAIAIATAVPAAAAPTREQAVTSLVDAFVAAQGAFDQAALARLTAPGYVEISPLGEVDPREKMLAFYAPDRKRQAPPLVLDERAVRLFGDTAVATARLSFGRAAMRAVHVARRDGSGWRLVSAQFTPIRTPPGS